MREQKFDLGEVAIVTFLQAKAYGKPYVLMPAVIVARGQHHTIFYNPERGHLNPGDLNGRKVVSAHTRKPPARGSEASCRKIMASTSGAFSGSPLKIRTSPSTPIRLGCGARRKASSCCKCCLMAKSTRPFSEAKIPRGTPLKPLIPDAAEAAARWAETHGGVPINHMMVIKESITQGRPDVVREVYRMLKESAAAAPSKTPGALRFGVEAVRKSLETIIRYSERQGLIPRRFSVDELFNDVTRSLD